MPQLNKAFVNRILAKNEARLTAIEGINYYYHQELKNSKELRQQLHKAINIMCDQIDELKIYNLPNETLSGIQQIIQKNSPCRLKSLSIYKQLGDEEPYSWYPSNIADSYISSLAPPPPLSPIASLTRVDTSGSTSSNPITSPQTSPSPEPSPIHTNLSLRNAFILHDLEQQLFIRHEEMQQAIQIYEDRNQTYLYYKDILHGMLAQIKLKKLIPQRFYTTKVPVSQVQAQPESTGLFSFLPQAPTLGERKESAAQTSNVKDNNEFGALQNSIVPSPQNSAWYEEGTPYQVTRLGIHDKNTNPNIISYKNAYDEEQKLRDDHLEIEKTKMLADKQVMEEKIKLFEEIKKQIEDFKQSEKEIADNNQKFFKPSVPVIRPTITPAVTVPKFIR